MASHAKHIEPNHMETNGRGLKCIRKRVQRGLHVRTEFSVQCRDRFFASLWLFLSLLWSRRYRGLAGQNPHKLSNIHRSKLNQNQASVTEPLQQWDRDFDEAKNAVDPLSLSSWFFRSLINFIKWKIYLKLIQWTSVDVCFSYRVLQFGR